jgi:hypothetical protein
MSALEDKRLEVSVTAASTPQAAAKFNADKPRPDIPNKPNEKPNITDKDKAKPKGRMGGRPPCLPTRHTRRPRLTRRNDGVTRHADSCTQELEYMSHHVRRNWQAWKHVGESGKVLKWIREGETIPFLNNRPPTPFNQGVSLLDVTPTQLTFVEAELARFVANGAWEPSTCGQYVFILCLVAKPGISRWRFIADLQQMNNFSVRKRLRM